MTAVDAVSNVGGKTKTKRIQYIYGRGAATERERNIGYRNVRPHIRSGELKQ